MSTGFATHVLLEAFNVKWMFENYIAPGVPPDLLVEVVLLCPTVRSAVFLYRM